MAASKTALKGQPDHVVIDAIEHSSVDSSASVPVSLGGLALDHVGRSAACEGDQGSRRSRRELLIVYLHDLCMLEHAQAWVLSSGLNCCSTYCTSSCGLAPALT